MILGAVGGRLNRLGWDEVGKGGKSVIVLTRSVKTVKPSRLSLDGTDGATYFSRAGYGPWGGDKNRRPSRSTHCPIV